MPAKTIIASPPRPAPIPIPAFAPEDKLVALGTTLLVRTATPVEVDVKLEWTVMLLVGVSTGTL